MSSKLTRRIKQAFDLFDTQANETVDNREIGSILRSLDIYPNQEALAQIIKDMGEDEPSAYVTWQKFHDVTCKLLEAEAHQRASEDTLLRAFKRLDYEKRGYLLPDELKNFMKMGESFTEDELTEMINACADKSDNKIYYQNFVTLLSKVVSKINEADGVTLK